MKNLLRQDFEKLDRSSYVLQQQLSASSGERYWAGVWRRLCKNPRAVFSLLLLVGLLFFTVVGPYLWTQSPTQQALGQGSLPPHWSGKATLVVEDNWQPARVDQLYVDTFSGDLKAVSNNLQINVESAHTEWVRLRWSPVAGASRYQIYRQERRPQTVYDLGLPLGDTLNAQIVGFEDRLKLRVQPYFYSVVAFSHTAEILTYNTIEVVPMAAIAELDAQLQGLLEGGRIQPGDAVSLPAHPLGTDSLGRDMLSRLMHGAQTSLFIGIVAPLLFVGLGVIYGAVAGYLGGVADNILMRFADFVIALPFLLFMILLKIAFGIGPGESGIWPMLLALLLLSWPGSARLVRAQVLQLREQPYVEAARLSGAGTGYLIVRHLLPNVLGVVLVSLSFAIPGAIFTEAFLSFIGMGVVPPTPSWGSMSQDGMKTLLSHPHELLLPSLFISITVLAFNLLGDALRDALDAKLD